MTILHPEFRRDAYGRGRSLMIDHSVQDVVDRLHNGDPTWGWEGDPALALYLEEGADGKPVWVLERLEDDGVYRVVCRSKPGVDLRGLIPMLVKHDRNRGHNAALDVIAANAKAAKARDDAAADAAAEKLEKVYWAAGKDVGHHYG